MIYISKMSTIGDLINKYTPIFYLHSEEHYFPSSMEWIMKNSTLIDHNKNTKIRSPTNNDLYKIGEDYKFEGRFDGDIVLSFSPDLYSGQRPLKDVPIYAYPRKVGDKIYITYVLVFPYNGSYDILGLISVGDHPFDIEHLTVELNENGELLRVYFGFHGSKDGVWVPKDKLQFEDGKIVAYLALNGHGIYPYDGVNFRLAGIANDVMNKGTKWTPSSQAIGYNVPGDLVPFNRDTMGWIMYNGRLGGGETKGDTSGITSLSDKGWIKAIDNPDNAFYNKPFLIGHQVFTGMILFKNLAAVLALYFIVLGVLYLLTKLINGDICGFPVTNHFITIGVMIALFLIFRHVAIRIIDKYAPK